MNKYSTGYLPVNITLMAGWPHGTKVALVDTMGMGTVIDVHYKTSPIDFEEKLQLWYPRTKNGDLVVRVRQKGFQKVQATAVVGRRVLAIDPIRDISGISRAGWVVAEDELMNDWMMDFFDRR